MRTTADVFADLAAVLRDWDGREYSGALTPATRFFADLGMASIDAVVLAETLQRHYGRKLPFNAFLAELGRRGATDLSVGELVEFLHRSLNAGEG
jgi:acyl carrier protein